MLNAVISEIGRNKYLDFTSHVCTLLFQPIICTPLIARVFVFSLTWVRLLLLGGLYMFPVLIGIRIYLLERKSLPCMQALRAIAHTDLTIALLVMA